MFYSEDVEIIRELMLDNQIDLYDLHLKYGLSPAQISRSVKSFLKKGVITVNGEVITITEIGKEWIVNNRQELFLDSKRKYWKKETEDTRYKEIDFFPLEFDIEIRKIIEEDEE